MTEHDDSENVSAGDGPHGPMVGDVEGIGTETVLVLTTLHPARQPFLDHYRIDGVSVLPAAMGLEALAEAGALVAPDGYRVAAIERASFGSPLEFVRDEPRQFVVTVQVEPDSVTGDTEDTDSTDLLVLGILSAEDPDTDLHRPTASVLRGTVRLSSDPPGGDPDLESTEPVVTEPTSSPMRADEVYSGYFHGPAYQVIGRGWRDGGRAVAQLAEDLPPDREPAHLPLLTAPRLVELCFQTAGLWEAGTEDRLALPARIEALRLLQDVKAVDGPLYGLARPVGPSTFDCAVVDGLGTVVLRMDGYRSVALPGPLPNAVLESLHITFASPDRAE